MLKLETSVYRYGFGTGVRSQFGMMFFRRAGIWGQMSSYIHSPTVASVHRNYPDIMHRTDLSSASENTPVLSPLFFHHSTAKISRISPESHCVYSFICSPHSATYCFRIQSIHLLPVQVSVAEWLARLTAVWEDPPIQVRITPLTVVFIATAAVIYSLGTVKWLSAYGLSNNNNGDGGCGW